MNWKIGLVIGAMASVVMAKEQPNIIVIMADDMGYADAGFTGATDILTPNLDQLAESGVIFEKGYVTHAFCAPSRAGFLAGRYQQRFGFEHNPPYDPANPLIGIDVGEKLFPKRLQEVGYTTGIIGKWHLGAAAPYNPLNRGFDHFYGFLTGGHDYFKVDVTAPVGTGHEYALQRDTQMDGFEGYLTTALSRDAVDFVEKNKANPFFLFLSYNAPHAPLQAPAVDIARYAHIKDKKRRVYAAMVDVMDRGIGEVVTALDTNGLRENTLIFFLSDNGGPIASKRAPTIGTGASNGPFRGGKTDYYDGGVHVPFIASWPGHIQAGQTYGAPVISLDIGRTAVELAGGDPMSVHEMEGVNLMPFLKGTQSSAPHDALFWRFLGKWSILTSTGYKHVNNPGSRHAELFNLNDDIGEKTDRVSTHPELAQEMKATWDQWDMDNVEMRNPVYAKYYRARDDFFVEATPEEAKAAGYNPEFERMFPVK